MNFKFKFPEIHINQNLMVSTVYCVPVGLPVIHHCSSSCTGDHHFKPSWCAWNCHQNRQLHHLCCCYKIGTIDNLVFSVFSFSHWKCNFSSLKCGNFGKILHFWDHFYKPHIPQKWWILPQNQSFIGFEWLLRRFSFFWFFWAFLVLFFWR